MRGRRRRRPGFGYPDPDYETVAPLVRGYAHQRGGVARKEVQEMTLFVIAGIYEGDDGAREHINLDAVSTITVVDKANNGYLSCQEW